ncbi:CLIP-associating protein 1 [Geodia barretti]|uniref:CLIP-associating protein 1 n=1 Tax=Geodia barretti TaxID=519541 RepID=A0AA35XM37_GEOBA|nr:CLIP-associating protein 1 [Geodia barretti]
MEARLLSDALKTDTHVRVQVAEELSDWMKNEENDPENFPELERLVGALAQWMGSSNYKVSIAGMEVLVILAGRMKDRFRPYISTVFPPLRERLGDSKEQVREVAQQLTQKIMVDVVSSPQQFLDKILETGLGHKNWRVKDQVLVCLSRAIDYFGAGQVAVGRHMAGIVTLLGDANSQVRSCAMDTIVEVYRHVGVKVRTDLLKRNVPGGRMATLNARFDAIDAATNAVDEPGTEDVDLDDASSGCSSLSARTQGSVMSIEAAASTGSYRSRTLPRPSSRGVASGSMAGGGSGGGVAEEDFQKAFLDVPSVTIYTSHDLDKIMSRVQTTLVDGSKPWEQRVAAMKEIRGVVATERVDRQQLLGHLKSMQDAFLTSLKDLRSQVTRETCVTLAYVSTVMGVEFVGVAENMLTQLIPLLLNSAKIMATSASICVKFILKNSPSHRLLNPISSIGLSSKSAIIRKQCAEFLLLALLSWERPVVEKAASVTEDLLRKGLADADATSRKHCRKAYWSYHGKLPSRAQRFFDSLDPQLQRHINDEKVAMEKGDVARPTSSLGGKVHKKAPPPSNHSNSKVDDSITPEMSATLKKALSSIANICPPAPAPLNSSSVPPDGAPGSPPYNLPATPSLRIQRPTVRISNKKPPLNAARSTENLLSGGPGGSPLHHRPSSRSGVRSGIRPPSRSGMLLKKKSSDLLLPGKHGSGVRLSRSHQPSPAHSRESSPHRPSSRQASGRVGVPTKETMLSLYGGGEYGDEDDDAASVNSEKSTFSVSSEVSISPYMKYANPVTDVSELLALCSSQSWSDRKDGMAQLKILLENPERELLHSDINTIKTIFKKMFSEPQMRIYSLFLEALSVFIEDHREHLEDWLFLILLRLLHRHGSDLLGHMHFKLQLILELIRKSFDTDQQFMTLCRILNDQSQPMNRKVRLAWLEYLSELIPLMDSGDLRENAEMRQAISKLIQATSEPKSGDIRRLSQSVITGLFDLNPATFSIMLRSVSKTLQDTANKILKVYMQEASSSSDDEPSSPSHKRPASQASRHRTNIPSSPSSKLASPRPATSTAFYRPTTPSRSRTPSGSGSTPESGRGLTPSRSSGGSGIPVPRSSSRTGMRTPGGVSRRLSASTSDVSDDLTKTPQNGLKQPSPRSQRSLASSTSSGNISGIPRRPGSTTPGQTPPTVRRQNVPPPRSASVDPDVMAERTAAAELKRPDSARSNYDPVRYNNGTEKGEDAETKTEGAAGKGGEGDQNPEKFLFSDLPRLDYGSGDEREEKEAPSGVGGASTDEHSRDQMALALRELGTSTSSKQKQTALQTIFTQARTFPEKCHWSEHFKTAMTLLLEAMLNSEEVPVRSLALRIVRELLKTEHKRMAEYAEIMTLRVLVNFADGDASVSWSQHVIFMVPACNFHGPSM